MDPASKKRKKKKKQEDMAETVAQVAVTWSREDPLAPHGHEAHSQWLIPKQHR